MELVSLSGLKITFRRAGAGAPLVLLHGGFGLDSRSWQPQLDGLADEFTVVAWDAPGCGGSDDPPAGFSLADYADCLAEFIAELRLQRPHVLGLSFGGALALALCGRHSGVPRSLVLAGAYAGWAGSLPPDEVGRRLHLISEQVSRPVDDWLPSYLPGMFGGPASDQVQAHTLSLMSGIRPAASLTMLRAMAAADLRDVLPRIRVPTLILHGELDVRAPLAVGRELHDHIPGSELVVLPDVGHLSNIEAAEDFNRAVRKFLRAQGEA